FCLTTAHNLHATPPYIRGLSELGDQPATASAISADGTTIVGSTYEFGAFRWTAAEGMTALGVLPGGTSSYASAASGNGRFIVGSSYSSTESQTFYWTPQTGMCPFWRAVCAVVRVLVALRKQMRCATPR